MSPTRKLLTAAIAGVAMMGLASGAFAASPWQKAHPRRAEVNHRLAHQNQRIRAERRSGQITGRRAAQLHHQDRAIRQEERTMARSNGGHLSKAEQHAINQQENQTSRRIGH